MENLALQEELRMTRGSQRRVEVRGEIGYIARVATNEATRDSWENDM
jgi:hypothetical protein